MDIISFLCQVLSHLEIISHEVAYKWQYLLGVESWVIYLTLVFINFF